MAHQMSFIYKRRYVIFDGVSACAACLDDVADSDMTTFTAEFKNLSTDSSGRSPSKIRSRAIFFLKTQFLLG